MVTFDSITCEVKINTNCRRNLLNISIVRQVPRGPRYQARDTINVAELIAMVSSTRFQRSCPDRANTAPFRRGRDEGWSCRRERRAWTSQSWLLSSWRLEGFRTRWGLLSWMDTQSEGEQGEVSGRAKSWTDAELPVDEASKRRHGACVMERRRRPFLRRLDPKDLFPIGWDNFKRNGYPWSNDWLNIAWKYSVSRSCVIGLHFR